MASFFFMAISLLYLMVLQCTIEGRLLSLSKPDINDAAAYARWLVSQNSWGVLKYLSFSLLLFLLFECNSPFAAVTYMGFDWNLIHFDLN